MKKYRRDYIASCRARVDADLRAYREGVGKAASKEFEGRFFNDQVLLLDYMFVHRLTGIEGKDDNPRNEGRVLCNSMLLNRGKMQRDKLTAWPNSAGSGISLPPKRSVLKLEVGDEVRLSEADFVRLSKAFFAELEKRFG